MDTIRVIESHIDLLKYIMDIYDLDIVSKEKLIHCIGELGSIKNEVNTMAISEEVIN